MGLPWYFAFCLSTKSSCKYKIELARNEQGIKKSTYTFGLNYTVNEGPVNPALFHGIKYESMTVKWLFL